MSTRLARSLPLLLLLSAACSDRPTAPQPVTPNPHGFSPIGLVEVTFTGLGSAHLRTTASVPNLPSLSTPRAAGVAAHAYTALPADHPLRPAVRGDYFAAQGVAGHAWMELHGRVLPELNEPFHRGRYEVNVHRPAG